MNYVQYIKIRMDRKIFCILLWLYIYTCNDMIYEALGKTIGADVDMFFGSLVVSIFKISFSFSILFLFS